MDHCSCAHGRMRCDALARGDDGIWSMMSSLAVSQEITAERALSTPPWTSKHHSAYQIALRTPIYSDFRLFSIRFSCPEKLRCHSKTQVSPPRAREGVARAATTPRAGATVESESITTGSAFSPLSWTVRVAARAESQRVTSSYGELHRVKIDLHRADMYRR